MKYFTLLKYREPHYTKLLEIVREISVSGNEISFPHVRCFISSYVHTFRPILPPSNPLP